MQLPLLFLKTHEFNISQAEKRTSFRRKMAGFGLKMTGFPVEMTIFRVNKVLNGLTEL